MNVSQLKDPQVKNSRVRISRIKAVVAALALLVWCLIGTLVMLFARLFSRRLMARFPLVFHGGVARLFGLRCEFEGTPAAHRPTVHVSNHVSYMDVFVLGSRIEGCFVAKSEVAGWPLFGKLAKLQNTIFLERRAQRAAQQIEVLRTHLQAGTSLILFPEGTSTSGDWVAPFRSSLFAAAEDHWIQPVTVAYLDVDGRPMSQSERDHYAWYLPDPKGAPGVPNSPFASHFFNGLGVLSQCRVRVVFHEPVHMEVGARKAIAQHCETCVRERLDRLLDVPDTDRAQQPAHVRAEELANEHAPVS